MEVAEKSSRTRLLLESLGKLPEPVARPAFIVVAGLPGSGKTYLSKRLAEKIPVVILESDALRKTLFPRPSHTPEESASLFREIHLLITYLLECGISLILDATNLSERFRERLYNIADRLKAKLVLVYVKAPREVISSRLEARKREQGSKSDADFAVYEKMLPTVEKIRRQHFVVDTSGDITPAINRIVKEAKR